MSNVLFSASLSLQQYKPTICVVTKQIFLTVFYKILKLLTTIKLPQCAYIME